MTDDLQKIRDSLKPGESKPLVSKGVHFGSISRRADGLWDTSAVEGLPRASVVSNGTQDPPNLVIRPWHQAANAVSLREFTSTSFNQHHGIQSTERFGKNTDPDGDGITNELSVADMTAIVFFEAAAAVPGRMIPNDAAVEKAVLVGEKTFQKIGCSGCHVPSLPLSAEGWIFSEPNPYNPPGNLRSGQTKTIRFDLNNLELPKPRLNVSKDKVVYVQAFTDFKLHDICDETDVGEPLDMNQTTWSADFKKGNKKFLTKRLWGVANEPPYFHHGLFTTLRQALLAHGGEASQTRAAFVALSSGEQDGLIEFLKTLQVLPPGTKDLIVDENYQPKKWTIGIAPNLN
ncbi:MAG: di-heme oxidoredictase family protein [Bryobacteraceae bacterium]